MKVFLDTRAIHKSYFEPLIERFKEIDFIFVEKNSYDADVIVSLGNFLNNETLNLYPKLKWVALLSAGYDKLDLRYFEERKIMLTNSKDVFSIQIAEDVFSKILYFNRNMMTHINNQKEKKWKFQKASHEIYESTIGIVGTGSIGQHIAERMKAFKTKVIGYKRTLEHVDFFDQIYTKQEGLNQLLKESDYVILALPLSPKTKHLIDAKAISLMKKDALLINVARGEIIDQDALMKALKKKQIRGAALDVTTPEPLPKNHELWTLDNCFVTPHDASASPKMNERTILALIETLDKYFKRMSLNNVVV